MPTKSSKFIAANVRGNVFIACKAADITAFGRIQLFEKATLLAVEAVLAKSNHNASQINEVIREQSELLKQALLNPGKPYVSSSPTSDVVSTEVQENEASAVVEAEAVVPEELVLEEMVLEETAEEEIVPEKPEDVAKPDPETSEKEERISKKKTKPVVKKMEDKLRDQRKPLEKILIDDCVHLRLVTKKRAKQLAIQLTGRTTREGEATVVAELRETLHQQIRKFIRDNKGGPWKSPNQQDDLRLDIAQTKTLGSLVMLTKQILREREQWESLHKQSPLSKLFGGKIKMNFGKKK